LENSWFFFVAFTKKILYDSPGPSHIVPVLVGDAAMAKAASDKLLSEHNIYVQSINYPTVAVGEERLRITVTPRHTLEQMDKLVRAVDKTFTELCINRLSDWKAVGGRAGVGIGREDNVEPIWTDKQLGLTDGTTPRTLRNNQKAVLDAKAVTTARDRFSELLGPINDAIIGRTFAEVSAISSLKRPGGTSARAHEQVRAPLAMPVSATA
jgi:5-aminolevulinate synthase